MGEVILDALIDTLKLLPVLLAVHILIEIFENKVGVKLSRSRFLKGKAAPLVGAAVGVIPQCGFSVVAAKFYSDKCITLGTMLAVFISTSDEALPILLSSPQSLNKLWPLILIKLVFAIVVGYSVDLVLRAARKKKQEIVPLSQALAEDTAVSPQTAPVTGCHNHEIGEGKEKGIFNKYLLHPILHTLVILGYILAVNLLLGIAVYFISQERLMAFMRSTALWQPFVTALIGLIPNCASSVLITQLYAAGGLTLGSAVAGLSVNAGLGFAVLFKDTKNFKRNLLILGFITIISALLGFGMNAILL